jgi:hypothetical protein
VFGWLRLLACNAAAKDLERTVALTNRSTRPGSSGPLTARHLRTPMTQSARLRSAVLAAAGVSRVGRAILKSHVCPLLSVKRSLSAGRLASRCGRSLSKWTCADGLLRHYSADLA